MATVLLQVAGAYLGGFLGTAGAAIGTAAGAIGGYLIDRALISSTQRFEGPRLEGPRPFTAEDGAPLPRVYGTVRVGGTMIWGTRFEETKRKTRQGGKGGPKVTTYHYFANVAFALCEGPIAGVRRVWADGRELDQDEIEMRVHPGTEDQQADPLIAAKQHPRPVPAFRGTAYVVFERFPLDEYGNRIPQFQFEVMRPAGTVAERVEAVALVPGSTEFGLSTRPVRLRVKPGQTEVVNRHTLAGATDLIASLDELQRLCPRLKHVALVVTWFGDDLRAGNCRIRPGVTESEAPGLSEVWRVSGVTRAGARLVSRHEGGPAFGGSPSDLSVMEAIAELKERGIAVTLYPFVMMDVPADNELPDPYGDASQGAYPWRGRITSMPAPGQPDSADRTAQARAQVDVFCGAAEPQNFSPNSQGVAFLGPASDWGYRRMVLHYAHLAAAAGGVDAFVLGSELRGLTTLRDEADAFPFVEELVALAADTKAVLGAGTAVTYGADWSEYFGYHPQDGSGDVYFHLDPLWAHPAVAAVGIDNYMPLSDWRDEDYAGGNPDGFRGPYDPVGLKDGIAAGEGFDWYYASAQARRDRARTPISDGAHGKPWVFRFKDLHGWWSSLHYDRVGGVEVATPTAWVPQSKPFWMTELGCAATDKGPNQPNVFPDPKSSEAAVPYHSNGGRSDAAQDGFLRAHLDRWAPDATAFEEAGNPMSPVYGGRMVAPDRLYLWAWDARPFPAFPTAKEVWSDGENWLLGHWLNGRISGATAGGIIDAVLSDHGLAAASTERVTGACHGYLVPEPTTARAALEPLLEVFSLGATEADGRLEFFNLASRNGTPLLVDELVLGEDEPSVSRVSEAAGAAPSELTLAFRHPLNEHQADNARVVVPGAAVQRPEMVAFPGTIEPGVAEGLAGDLLRRRIAGRETVQFAVPPGERRFVPGAVFGLADDGVVYLAEEIEDGLVRRVSGRRVPVAAPRPQRVSLPGAAGIGPGFFVGPPLALFMDLPLWSGLDEAQDQFRVAARAMPWRTQVVFASPEETGFAVRSQIEARSVIGELRAPLGPGFEGRFDHAAAVEVELFDGELASVSEALLLNGANTAAVEADNGVWEIVQFAQAEEVAPSVWRLTQLLRGQAGTGDAAAAGAAVGAGFVLLDETVRPAGLGAAEIGLTMNWRVAPAGYALAENRYAQFTGAGGVRALMPLAPVRFRAREMPSGNLSFSWIRRGRIDADSWLATEIPLGEESESYRVEVLWQGVAVRSVDVATPAWTYTTAQMTADIPLLLLVPVEVTVAVRQVSAAVGPGLAARLTLTLDRTLI